MEGNSTFSDVMFRAQVIVATQPKSMPSDDPADFTLETAQNLCRKQGYRFIRRLGYGGEAHVYMVQDRKGQYHALRIGKKAYTSSEDYTWKSPLVAQAGLLRHVRVMSELHKMRTDRGLPSLIPLVYSIGYHKLGERAVPFADLEYLPGEAVTRQKLMVPDALAMGIDVAEALTMYHELFPHRDVKPDNIIHEQGVASRLIDLGRQDYIKKGIVCTVAYAAPEVIFEEWISEYAVDLRHELETRRDIYALGITLYRQLTGRLPFAKQDPKKKSSMDYYKEDVYPVIAHRNFPALDTLVDVPVELSNLVNECLDPDPFERPSAGLLSMDLQQIARNNRIRIPYYCEND
jgi:serine/threonine protein kinase